MKPHLWSQELAPKGTPRDSGKYRRESQHGAQARGRDSSKSAVCKFCIIPRQEPRCRSYKGRRQFTFLDTLLITIFLLENLIYSFEHVLKKSKSCYQKIIPIGLANKHKDSQSCSLHFQGLQASGVQTNNHRTSRQVL